MENSTERCRQCDAMLRVPANAKQVRCPRCKLVFAPHAVRDAQSSPQTQPQTQAPPQLQPQASPAQLTPVDANSKYAIFIDPLRAEDRKLIAQVAAPLLQLTVADLVQQLARQPTRDTDGPRGGFLARDLAAVQSRLLAQHLGKAGIRALLLQEQQILSPPSPTPVDAGCCTPEGLDVRVGHGLMLVVPYKDIRFGEVACLPVQQSKEIESYAWNAADQRMKLSPTSETVNSMEWIEVLELFRFQPLQRIRIECDQFRHLRGETSVVGGKENLTKLAASLQIACRHATFGSGWHSLIQGQVRARRRVLNEAAYNDQLTVELTRLALAHAGGQ